MCVFTSDSAVGFPFVRVYSLLANSIPLTMNSTHLFNRVYRRLTYRCETGAHRLITCVYLDKLGIAERGVPRACAVLLTVSSRRLSTLY